MFLGTNIPKRKKYTKWPQTTYSKRSFIIPNGSKIFQMVIKYDNIFFSKTLQILPKLGFLVENKPSGNPAGVEYHCQKTKTLSSQDGTESTP
jgi:hypothetical protein